MPTSSRQLTGVLLGTLASIASITSLVWQLSSTTDKSPSGPWLLLAVGFIFLIALQISGADTRKFRFAVVKSCRRMKMAAKESIEIAAGDCSWVPEELPLLKSLLDEGIKIELLWHPTGNSNIHRAVAELSKKRSMSVRVRDQDMSTYFLCILVDRDRPGDQKLLILEKHSSRQSILGLVPLPSCLRRDLSVTFVDPSSRMYSVCSLLLAQTMNRAASFTEETKQDD